jgi:hypothetical protein
MVVEACLWMREMHGEFLGNDYILAGGIIDIWISLVGGGIVGA